MHFQPNLVPKLQGRIPVMFTATFCHSLTGSQPLFFHMVRIMSFCYSLATSISETSCIYGISDTSKEAPARRWADPLTPSPPEVRGCLLVLAVIAHTLVSQLPGAAKVHGPLSRSTWSSIATAQVHSQPCPWVREAAWHFLRPFPNLCLCSNSVTWAQSLCSALFSRRAAAGQALLLPGDDHYPQEPFSHGETDSHPPWNLMKTKWPAFLFDSVLSFIL